MKIDPVIAIEEDSVKMGMKLMKAMHVSGAALKN